MSAPVSPTLTTTTSSATTACRDVVLRLAPPAANPNTPFQPAPRNGATQTRAMPSTRSSHAALKSAHAMLCTLSSTLPQSLQTSLPFLVHPTATAADRTRHALVVVISFCKHFIDTHRMNDMSHIPHFLQAVRSIHAALQTLRHNSTPSSNHVIDAQPLREIPQKLRNLATVLSELPVPDACSANSKSALVRAFRTEIEHLSLLAMKQPVTTRTPPTPRFLTGLRSVPPPARRAPTPQSAPRVLRKPTDIRQSPPIDAPPRHVHFYDTNTGKSLILHPCKAHDDQPDVVALFRDCTISKGGLHMHEERASLLSTGSFHALYGFIAQMVRRMKDEASQKGCAVVAGEGDTDTESDGAREDEEMRDVEAVEKGWDEIWMRYADQRKFAWLLREAHSRGGQKRSIEQLD